MEGFLIFGSTGTNGITLFVNLVMLLWYLPKYFIFAKSILNSYFGNCREDEKCGALFIFFSLLILFFI